MKTYPTTTGTTGLTRRTSPAGVARPPSPPAAGAPGKQLQRAWLPGLATLVSVAALAVGLVWAYEPTFHKVARRWEHDPQYSHGYIVPLFALAVLWFRRDRFPSGPLTPRWGGLLLVGLGAALRLAGAWFYVDWFDGLSLLPVLVGVCALTGGWRFGGWAAPAVALLAFMVPLPAQLESALSGPLRGLATTASTYALQTLGLPAVAEGNIILIDDVRVGVHEACSGLGMLFAFFALSAAVSLIIRRPLVERVIVFLSAIPIGVLMNLVRITAAGFVFRHVGGATARAFFHDASGWLMMPLALVVLWLELQFLARFFTDRFPEGPVPLASAPAAPPARTT